MNLLKALPADRYLVHPRSEGAMCRSLGANIRPVVIRLFNDLEIKPKVIISLKRKDSSKTFSKVFNF